MTDVLFWIIVALGAPGLLFWLLDKTARNNAEVKNHHSRRRAAAAAADCSGSPTTPRP